jgi:hypothetical protein
LDAELSVIANPLQVESRANHACAQFAGEWGQLKEEQVVEKDIHTHERSSSVLGARK